MPGSLYTKDLEKTDEKIVCWLKIFSIVPTGASAKMFINEITRLFDQ